MAELKIKQATGSSAPTTLAERTLGMYENDLYYGGTTGNSTNKPIKILSTVNVIYDAESQTLKIGD